MNPFIIKEIPVDAPFCDREKELAELTHYAASRSNVVIYSPRRLGKTSLIKRVQNTLLQEGMTAIYVNLFGVNTTEDIAAKIARAMYAVLHRHEGLFRKAVRALSSFRPVLVPSEEGISVTVQPAYQKGGLEILEETMASINRLLGEVGPVSIVLDEFQEITAIGDSLRIEGILREKVQSPGSSFFFVGSRRRILLEMFNTQKRPFYGSAFSYQVGKLPREPFAAFIQERFASAGSRIRRSQALKICKLLQDHPYYVQKFCFLLFSKLARDVTDGLIAEVYELLLEVEGAVFQAFMEGLSKHQRLLLIAMAKEPTRSVYAVDYIKSHHLGSIGGVQGALKALSVKDLVEKDGDGIWGLVDPVFRSWIVNRFG